MNHDFKWAIEPADPHDDLFGRHVSTSANDAPRSSAILFGLPFDGAVLGRCGAAAGPQAIRAAARVLKAYSFAKGALPPLVHDIGDIILSGENVAQAHADAEQAARMAVTLAVNRKRKKNARVIVLGGDHSLSYPCALPYLEHFRERLAVINLDAHLDVRSVPQGEPPNSGTSFGRLLDAGLKSYAVIGARDFQTSEHYVKRMQEARGKIVCAGEVFSRGAEKVARRVLKSLPERCEAIYLSVDLDVADASVAPAVSAPTPGGLLAHQVFELVRAIASDPRVVACDIMELAPRLEEAHSDRSARLAAGCLAEMVAAI